MPIVNGPLRLPRPQAAGMSALRPVRPATANRPAFAMPPSAELADALAFLVAGGRRNRPAFAMPGRLLTAPGPMPIEWLVPRFVQPSPRISAPPPAAAVLETTEAPLAPVTAPRRPRVLLGGV